MHARRWMSMRSAVLTLILCLAGAAVFAGPKKDIDWTALNAAFAGATFVNDPEICRVCHEESMETFDHTRHAQAFRHTLPRGGMCESCHGPGSKHVENPTDELRLENLTAAQQSMICLQCHEGGSRFGWKFGAHRANAVSCLSCHRVMEEKSARSLLVKGSPRELINRNVGPRFTGQAQAVSETCYQCHSDVRSDMTKMSHHPVREGRMDCTSCHNVHGGTPGLLVKNTLNETCVSCHTEKRGPFVWEHPPVRENCANCHTPHGSNHRHLLANKDSFLCLSCHSYGGHVNLPRYNRVSNPFGSGCLNCHITTHGSNHPSGAKLTR